MLAGYSGERDHTSTKDSGTHGPLSSTRRRDPEEGPCGPGRGPKSGSTPPGRTAHPLGSQRSLLLTYVLKEINAVAPAGTEGSAAVKEMLRLQTAQLDEFFVRLKAKHDKPREAGRGCGH